MLFAGEVYVIDQEHIKQDNDHEAVMDRQQTQFAATMREFFKTNKNENGNFGKLLDKESDTFNGMKRNTRDMENALTGGDSYVIVMPIWVSDPITAEFPLMVSVAGKNTMYDVTIEMQEGDINAQYMASHMKEYLVS